MIKYDSIEKLQVGLEVATKRDERARDRVMKRVAVENEKRLQEETDSKRQKIGELGEKVMDISFDADSAMEMERLETETGAAT